MIKYIGSKRTLLPLILRAIHAARDAKSVIDLFSGTSRVGHVLKRDGFRVLSNDHNAYAHTLAQCYVAADRERVEHDARKLIDELNRMPGDAGYFTETFCVKSRFFQPKNGARIDAIREEIEKKALEPLLRSVVLVSLMEAADRVDSTCGLQMAYLKDWAARASNELELRMPDVLSQGRNGASEAHCLDALTATQTLKADIAYIDPPYNQHSYLGNYHVWESLILWDKPEVYGIACKRIDCRTRKSDFNRKTVFHSAMRAVIDAVDAKVLLVSFNNEGYIRREEMEALLRTRGRVHVVTQDYKRYVGAQIGIHNLQGEKVGEVSHLRNLEYLYIVETAAADLDLSWIEREAANTPALELAAPSHDRVFAVARASPAAASTDELVARVRGLLQERRMLRSEEAQAALGISSAELRGIFQILVARQEATISGQRRGTVYHWSAVNPAEAQLVGASVAEPIRPKQQSLFG